MLDLEILQDFRTEAKGLLGELAIVVETLEGENGATFPAAELEQFAQKIDRIMGAAQTLCGLDPGNQGLERIGAIAQLCKRMGYKAAEYRVAPLVPIFAAFWADTLEVLSELIDSLEDESEMRNLASAFSSTLQNRLMWLGDKVQKMAPAGASGGLGTQLEVDQLIKSLAG